MLQRTPTARRRARRATTNGCLSCLPAQVGTEFGRIHQPLDLTDATEPPPLDLVERYPVLAEGLVELPSAVASRPLRREARQRLHDLGGVDPIVSGVGAGVGRELDFTPGDGLVHDLGQL